MCYITDMARDKGLRVDIGPVVNEDRERWYTFMDPAGREVGRALGRPAAVDFIYSYSDASPGLDRKPGMVYNRG